jgi:RNA polymerase sigma-70 factor, ECF subfamily
MASGAGAGGDTPAGESDLSGLIVRIAAGDEAAFAALYRLTAARLNGVVSRILPADAAAEALQDAYVRVWRRAADFDPAKGSALAWMAAIARNRALDEVRRPRPVSLEDMPEGFEAQADAIDPLAAREMSEGLRALLDCLEGLDKEKRDILMLAYYRGASREALAERFGKPVSTIKTWLRRSLAQLRMCLDS